MLFQDRADAGRALARKLTAYSNQPNTIVLALPRGGVPVAYEVATALNLLLDVFIVRKLGVPGEDELAMGAIASGDIVVLNERLIKALGISDEAIQEAIDRERIELERRELAYRNGRPLPKIEGQTVILVDDGLATGASMYAATKALRQKNPGKFVVAVPVASNETCEQFRSQVDDIICARTPDPFFGVGRWYRDFSQTDDDEVTDLLARANNRAFR
jgi:putative phosphoribosyl transferase